jgi:hypothetical protein
MEWLADIPARLITIPEATSQTVPPLLIYGRQMPDRLSRIKYTTIFMHTALGMFVVFQYFTTVSQTFSEAELYLWLGPCQAFWIRRHGSSWGVSTLRHTIAKSPTCPMSEHVVACSQFSCTDCWEGKPPWDIAAADRCCTRQKHASNTAIASCYSVDDSTRMVVIIRIFKCDSRVECFDAV